jgi:hypothetical protein
LDEYETPDELAKRILENAHARLAKKDVQKLPMTLLVQA